MNPAWHWRGRRIGRMCAARLLLAATALLSGSDARADQSFPVAADPGSGIVVRLSTPLNSIPRFGFLPVEVAIENNSDQPGTWHLDLSSKSASPGRIETVTTITVPAGQNRRQWIFLPVSEPGVAVAPVEFSKTAFLAVPRQLTAVAGVLPAPEGITTVIKQVQEQADRLPFSRTFKITQHGPWNALPLLPPESLPVGAYMYRVRSDDPARSTRVTVVSVYSTPRRRPAPKAPAEVAATAGRLLAEVERIAGAAAETELTEEKVTALPTSRGLITIDGASVSMPVFRQIGAADTLRIPAEAFVPPGMVINLHPGPRPGQVVRTVSYIDPADLELMGPADQIPTGTSPSLPLLAARAHLRRHGYRLVGNSRLAEESALTPQQRTAIFTELGTSNLLAAAAPDSLPAFVASSVAPSSSSVLVERTLRVTMPVFAPDPTPPPLLSAAFRGKDPELVATISGPGFAQRQVLSLDASLDRPAASTLPLAVGTDLEPALRAKIADLALAGSPSLAPVDVATLPVDWRVWSSFQSVILRQAVYESTIPSMRSALRSWVALGGRLFLVPDTPGPARHEPLGVGFVQTLETPLSDADPVALALDLRLNSPPLALPRIEDAKFFAADSAVSDVARSRPRETQWVLVVLLGYAIVACVVHTPLRPLLRRGRGAGLGLLFSPLVKVSAVVLVLEGGLLLLEHGGNGSRATVVVMVPGENVAAVFQDQAVRTGFVWTGAFPLKDDVVLTSLAMAKQRATPDDHSVQWRNGEVVDGGLQSHRIRVHQLRALVPSRGRIEQVGTDARGAPIVVSTLPGELHEFRLTDSDAATWVAARVPMGVRVTLVRAVASPRTEWDSGGSRYLNRVLNTATAPAPGRWVARGARASELAPIPTLPSIAWKNDTVWYTGLATGEVARGR